MGNIDFWASAGKEIFWYQAPTRVLDDSNAPAYRWYPDGEPWQMPATIDEPAVLDEIALAMAELRGNG